MDIVNEYGEKRNGFTEVVAFCYVTCRYFDRFLLQGVDRNWRQACFFYLAPGLICEGYWQVNSRRSIFRIADPNLSAAEAYEYLNKAANVNKELTCLGTNPPVSLTWPDRYFLFLWVSPPQKEK